MRRCALPRRYYGSHGVPLEIWERERSKLEAAVAKGEEGRAEVRDVLARLASTRLGQHQRDGARGEHNDPVNTFFDDYAAENDGEKFCIPDNAEVLAVLYSKQDESRTQFFEKLREYEDLYLDQIEVMVESAVPCRSRLVSAQLKSRDLTRACACAGGRIVKLTVATKASGAAALTELVLLTGREITGRSPLLSQREASMKSKPMLRNMLLRTNATGPVEARVAGGAVGLCLNTAGCAHWFYRMSTVQHNEFT